jgi:CBS domain-containing protein
MTTVKHLLDRKGHVIHSVRKGATVFDAIAKMAENDIGSLLVMGKASPTTLVEEIMRTAVLFARPEQTIEECMAVMTKHRVRHLPVLDGERVSGVVSIGDLVASTIADQKFAIEQLEHYIRS